VTPRPAYQVSVLTQQQVLSANPDAAGVIAAGWQWLINQGYMARDATQTSADWVVVTELGRRALQEPGAARARTLLGRDVDPALGPARRAFEAGDLELAVHSALRAVEVAVRDASGLPNAVHGVDTMVQAFRPTSGPLIDAAAPPGEQEGLIQLFRGAHLAYRNPASHRDVEYADPAEAAEVVLLANLLLRITHRAAARRGSGSTS
jgi:uncharacterized protein (TIGR02391 family)